MSEVRANSITNAAGTGAPDFPNGLTTGVASFPDGTAADPSITNTGDTNTGIFFPAADTIAFSEGGVESMRIDASGNLGLGVTPGTWASAARAMQISSFACVAQTANGAFTAGFNFRESASDVYTYLATDQAGRYEAATDGSHRWLIAPSGTAGNAITFTQAMTLDASGNLLVGTTSAGGLKMNITGGRSGLTTSAGDSYVLYMRNPSYTNGCHIGNPGENMFAISTASGAERLVIGASGQIGINGVNYGTAGQVLTSGGSGAAPSWASVGTATAGLAYGDVGSYGWLATRTTASVVAGSTYAGSGLVPAGVYSNINVADNSAGPANGSAIGVGSGALSGTWRAMGSFTFGSGNTYVRGTTFLRIS